MPLRVTSKLWAFKSQIGVAEAMRDLREEINREHVALRKAQEFIAFNFGSKAEHAATLKGEAPNWIVEDAKAVLDYDAGPHGFTAGVIASMLRGITLKAA
jgi:hypothetical protein